MIRLLDVYQITVSGAIPKSSGKADAAAEDVMKGRLRVGGSGRVW